VEGVGYVCSFANLDSALEKRGDPDWGSGFDPESGLEKGKERDEQEEEEMEKREEEGTEPVASAGMEAAEHPDFERELQKATRTSRNGKMEKSLLNFVVRPPPHRISSTI
jgi:hypothetical protein